MSGCKCEECGNEVNIPDATHCNRCWELNNKFDSYKIEDPIGSKKWLYKKLDEIERKERSCN